MITEAVLAPVASGVRDIRPLLDTIIVAGGPSGGPPGDPSGDPAGDPAGDKVIGYEDLISEAANETRSREPVDIPDESPALIMYTSGTTGRQIGRAHV